MKRRTFLLKALGATAAAGAGLAGYSYAVETRNVQFERLTLQIPGLPRHLDGYTIGVLADIHVGPTTDGNFVRGVAERLAAMKPDLVVMAGDFIGSHEEVHAANWSLEPVKGCVGVLGNWDYYDRNIRHVMSNVKLLINAGVQVADGLWVGGVDEPRLGEPDVGQAMAGAPEGAVRILLCHEPDYADEIVKPEHKVALQISGHSHAGQIRLPGVGPLLLPPGGRKYHTGWYQTPHCQLYVSRGLGTAHLPFRLFCPPEVTLLSLGLA